jgi:AcrR family transcriptional regulator
MRVRERRVTFDSVLDVAEHLANRSGLQALSLVLIAKELGIRSPSLYNHIDGLASLKRELALKGLREFTRNVLQAMAGKSGDDAIRAFCYTTRDFAKVRPGLYEAMQLPRSKADRELHAAVREFGGTIGAALSAYHLEPTSARYLMRIVRSMTYGFITLEKNEGFSRDLDIEESFSYMVEWFISTLNRKQSLVPRAAKALKRAMPHA